MLRWVKIQGIIKDKKAILLAWPMVRTVDRNRSISESIVEKRNPTECEAPLPPSPAPGPPVLPATPPPASEKLLVDHEKAVPTGFETRNLGATLEVEATVLDEGKRVFLSLVPQRVELLEMESYQSSVAHGKMMVDTPQPIFGTTKTTLSFKVESGQRQLVGVHKLNKPANYVELHLVRAVVTKAE